MDDHSKHRITEKRADDLVPGDLIDVYNGSKSEWLLCTVISVNKKSKVAFHHVDLVLLNNDVGLFSYYFQTGDRVWLYGNC